MIPHVGASGTVHAAIPSGLNSHGKPYDGYDFLWQIARDIKAGDIEWVAIGRQGGPVEYSEALELAAGEPWERAEKYQPHFQHYFDAHPRNFIIGRNDDPDPLGLFR